MVLLRHDLPDGTGHFDWLLECPGREGLITFRVAERIDQPGCRGFGATRAPDHRREYLTYEGPISGGRGVVSRVASGKCEVEEADGAIRVRALFDGRTLLFHGRRMGGDRWEFDVV
jgi:hypothetical protein